MTHHCMECEERVERIRENKIPYDNTTTYLKNNLRMEKERLEAVPSGQHSL